MREALLQPEELTNEILRERSFARVYEKSRSAPTEMTEGDWAFLEWADASVNPEPVLSTRIVEMPA